jgi:hypothetical protein
LDRHKAVCESVMKSIEKRCNYNVGKWKITLLK